jgi:hypothetical protein
VVHYEEKEEETGNLDFLELLEEAKNSKEKFHTHQELMDHLMN